MPTCKAQPGTQLQLQLAEYRQGWSVPHCLQNILPSIKKGIEGFKINNPKLQTLQHALLSPCKRDV